MLLEEALKLLDRAVKTDTGEHFPGSDAGTRICTVWGMASNLRELVIGERHDQERRIQEEEKRRRDGEV